MKSASKYAIEAHYGDGHQKGCSPCCAIEIDLIKKALTEFAEEQVKEVIDGYNDTLALKEARNAALDEAAKVAEARCQCPHHISIAYEIRALKK